MNTLMTSPLQRAAQELECLKQAINWKVEDVESGYDILLAQLVTDDQDYNLLNTAMEQAIARHTAISQLSP